MNQTVQPIKQYVKYVGPKASIEIQFPIPFKSKSEAQGSPITFYHNKPEPLTPDQAKQLCSVSGETFKMCDEQGKALKV